MTTGFGFCATCGTPRLAADQKFCAVCGSALAPMAPPAPAPVAPPPAPPAPVVVAPAPAPAFAEASAASAPQVEAAIPAPPAPDTSASEAAAAPPPWATFAAPPAPEPGPPVVEAAPAPVAPPPAPPTWSVAAASDQAATTPPAAPPAWSQPPAAPTYQPAPTYPVAPTYQPIPAFQAAPAAPGAPAAARAGFKITPQILLIGVAVLAVIVGAFVYMNMNSSSGGLTFTPSTISCSKPVAFTTSVRLPSSLKATDKITITLDGKPVTTATVSDASDMIQQPDGSWTSVSTTSVSDMQTMCAAGGSAGGINILTPGTHTMQVLDSTGTKVLASGSYTVTP